MGNLNRNCNWPNCGCLTEAGDPCRFEDPDFYIRRAEEAATRSAKSELPKNPDGAVPAMRLRIFLSQHMDVLWDARTHRRAWSELIDQARTWAGSLPSSESDAHRDYCDHEKRALMRLLDLVDRIPQIMRAEKES